METHDFIISLNGKKFPMSTYKKFKSDFGHDGISIERKTREWFSSQIKKDDIVFDIGANIGIYSILFSQLTDNTYSFEPTNTYDFLLLPNLQKNNLKNVKTYKIAFGDKVGRFDEKIYMIWGDSPVQETFEFTTLDEFSVKNNLIPKYLKIDVDGFDLEVLLGGKNLLLNNDVVVCVEVNHALHTRGHKEQDILDFMNNIGYNLILRLDDENFIFKK